MTNDPYAYSYIHSFRLIFISCISRFKNIRSVVKGYVLLLNFSFFSTYFSTHTICFMYLTHEKRIIFIYILLSTVIENKIVIMIRYNFKPVFYIKFGELPTNCVKNMCSLYLTF